MSLRSVSLLLSAGLVTLLGLTGSGCATRVETPVATADSTIVYPARKAGDVDVAITLCRAISKKTGKPLGARRSFELAEKKRVRALVDIENVYGRGTRPLLFHLVWIGPDDKRFYDKVLEYAPNDSVTTLATAISRAPNRREPGHHTFQVYLFRELIAEKHFELISPTTGS